MNKNSVKVLFFNGIQNRLGKNLLERLCSEFINLKTIITVYDKEKIYIDNIDIINLNYREILYGIYEGIEGLSEINEQDFLKYKESFFDIFKMLDRLHSVFNLNDRNKIRIILNHIKFFENLNKKYKIDLAIFMNVPHEIFDFTSFISFKKRNINTLYYYQLNFEYLYSINDDLDFKTFNWREDSELSETSINNSLLNQSFKKWTEGDYHPFYMNFQNFEIKKSKNRLNGLLEKLNYFLQLRNNYKKSGYLDIDYLHFFISKKIILNSKVRKLLKKNEKSPDFNKKYVFIPLNYQPEATTSPYGGYFIFQDKMIKLISESIPSDWLIYVKEHPKQIKYFARDDIFYSDILNKKNVQFVRSSESSFDLLKNSQFVATVTGTLGIQSFCNQKPVLLFGESFFKDAPGVFKVKDSENLKKIINEIIDGRFIIKQTEIIKYFNHLEEKYFFGFSDFDYGPYSNLNWDENIDQLTSNTINFLKDN